MTRLSLPELTALLLEIDALISIGTTLNVTYSEFQNSFVAATPDGTKIFRLSIHDGTDHACIVLEFLREESRTFQIYSLDYFSSYAESEMLPFIRECKPAYIAPFAVFDVPEWYKDPAFVAWLDHPKMRSFTYHRHGDKIGEFSDVMVHVDGEEGDSTDMPEHYWRKVVAMAKQSGASMIKLRNIQ